MDSGLPCIWVEPFLLGTVDDPAETVKCLEKLKEITILFGKQIDSGADILTLPDHATGDLVSGEYYKRFYWNCTKNCRRIKCSYYFAYMR